ncbi:PDR/VanB family oxidoreductase [Streptomyces sp. SID4917]|uniref:PDR/VanB family oxidoreductase n=1 Tax=unclassified Streptomyces TaxID=2593676 RepID=UPI00081DCD03|nr:Ferredoxin-NADP reductase [Streptomyces sp. MnatMP-M17]
MTMPADVLTENMNRVTEASTLPVVVAAVAREADDVLSLVLQPAEGGSLPPWRPGAHVDLILRSGLVRQYSLCGDPADLTAYTVAVLREQSGRGGSQEIHATVTAGTALALRGPRNHFEFVQAQEYLFIAGGIGITPLIPMINKAESAGAAWKLVYGGRSRTSMAYVEKMRALGGDRVTVLPEDVAGRPDLEALLDDVTEATHIYSCGPGGLLDALQAMSVRRGLADRLHIERFSAAADALTGPVAGDGSFDLVLAQSGLTVRVEADQTIYEAVQDVAPDLLFSCAEGYCGTCQVAVVTGTPDHRDTVASPEEHEAEGTMILCVGRSKSSELVIDA